MEDILKSYPMSNGTNLTMLKESIIMLYNQPQAPLFSYLFQGFNFLYLVPS